MIKRVLYLVSGLFAVVAAVCIGRAIALDSRQKSVAAVDPQPVDLAAVTERLAAAIRFRTISELAIAPSSLAEFDGLHAYLRDSFPLVHAVLRREPGPGRSLLYTWAGHEPELPPVVLLAHQDVVPITAGTETDWAHPPFSGRIADGFIWGRGAIDNKAALMGVLETIEGLLAEGFEPRRTVHLVLADDEEVRGSSAKEIADRLRARDGRAELVVDEGLFVTRGIVPGMDRPTALVGVAEKGFLSVELAVESDAVHVAMPPRGTSVGQLAAALVALERDRPEARLDGAPRELFEWLGAEMGFAGRLVAANLWLFGPLVKAGMTRNPPTDALLRTSTAITMLEGSPRQNVLPRKARAVALFFVRPGESTTDVESHVREVVGEGVQVRRLEAAEPTRRSPTDGAAFELLDRSIREVFRESVVAPSMLVGNVDARHYASLSENVYRFTPIVVDPEDVKRVHGTNERIGVEAYADVIRFYDRLIRNSCQ